MSLRLVPSFCLRARPAHLSASSLRWHTPSGGRSFSTPAPPSPTPAPTPAPTVGQLAGTAPAHRCYAFLHTSQPPSTYPAKYTTPVQRQLLCAIASWGGAVNFAWSTPQQRPVAVRGDAESETHHLTAFSSVRGKLEIQAVSLMNVEDVGEALRAHAEPLSHAPVPSTSDDTIHLYVCTHGARDCRCGETGGAVARAIRAELESRQQGHAFDPSTRIQLAEVAHVGGHQYAGNVLVYPHGEWLGNVKPEDVSDMIDAILARPVRPMHAEDIPICPSHWRGRMGLTTDEQIALFNRFSDQY